jgi:hypothetical protein
MSTRWFDQSLEAVESLSLKDFEDGFLYDYAFFCGTRADAWGISFEQMQGALISAAQAAGYDNTASEVIQGVRDGMKVAQLTDDESGMVKL